VTFSTLLEGHQSIEAVYQYLIDEPKYKIKPDLKAAEDMCLRAQKEKVEVCTLLDADYPDLLSSVRDAPPVLFLKGNRALLAKNQIAIVGARQASIAGQKIAYSISLHLTSSGYSTVSGFARGIDYSVHKGAQDHGSIAVFAGGIDQVFPPEHIKYVDEFLETGLIISEMPLGHKPVQQNFPRRNRIISGLSRAVIVVEAAYQSGSLLTASYALEQGREVGAVPGSPLDPRCKGSNKLLREGAHFIENAWDAMDLLGNSDRVEQKKDCSDENAVTNTSATTNIDLEETIISLLGYSPTEINELLNQIPAQAHEALGVISALELAGKIVRGAGNEISLRPPL
jgi:DNA processing protein